MATKLYRNDGKEKIDILGVGELKPGEQISMTGQYLPVVILENYPGLVDLTDPEFVDTKEQVAQASETELKTSNVVKDEQL